MVKPLWIELEFIQLPAEIRVEFGCFAVEGLYRAVGAAEGTASTGDHCCGEPCSPEWRV